VLDSQFKGMKQALEIPTPAAMQRVKDMLADLRQMLDADTRGEHTQQDFDDFMAQYGDMFPDNPTNLEELVDSLVLRMQAAERLLESLSDEQREELANLMAQAMEDAGLAAELSALGDALRARRPELGQPQRGVRMPGGEPLGLGRRDERGRGNGGPRRPGVRARPGLPGCQHGGRRRGSGPPRARQAGGRRPAGACAAWNVSCSSRGT